MSSKVHFAWAVGMSMPQAPYLATEEACIQKMSRHYECRVETTAEWWPMEFLPVNMADRYRWRYHAWKPVYKGEQFVAVLLALS